MPHAGAITKERLLHDRKQLVAIVRDCRNGRAGHLREDERKALVDRVRQRIEELDQRIQRIGDVRS